MPKIVTNFEKLTDCEYEEVDTTSAPCHNTPIWVERERGIVVCEAHRASLEVFLQAESDKFQADADAADAAQEAADQKAANIVVVEAQ